MKRHHFVHLGTFAYFGFIASIMFLHNLWFSPDHFLIAAIIFVLFLGRGKQFVRDWFPFIIMFLGYEALRGINPEITHVSVNIENVISWEKTIFGTIPTIYLQNKLFNWANIGWHDIYLSIIYMSHFAAFLFFSFVLWIKKHSLFKPFTYTILLLSYAAFVTFVLFPVMPPWMASEKGYLPKVERIMYQTTPVYTQPTSTHMPTIYDKFAANKTAAIPSLHAAYPLVLFLFALLLKKSLFVIPTFIYLISAWFGVVYLGEHYVVDVIAGAIYALIAFFAVRKFTA